MKPVLGHLPVCKIDAHALESFYTELRRCRIRCDGKPFVEKHKTEGEHDCVEQKCKVHKCNPLAKSAVRQIHSVISGTLSAAERVKERVEALGPEPKARRTPLTTIEASLTPTSLPTPGSAGRDVRRSSSRGWRNWYSAPTWRRTPRRRARELHWRRRGGEPTAHRHRHRLAAERPVGIHHRAQHGRRRLHRHRASSLLPTAVVLDGLPGSARVLWWMSCRQASEVRRAAPTAAATVTSTIWFRCTRRRAAVSSHATGRPALPPHLRSASAHASSANSKSPRTRISAASTGPRARGRPAPLTPQRDRHARLIRRVASAVRPRTRLRYCGR